jgi:hypothetical protein
LKEEEEKVIFFRRQRETPSGRPSGAPKKNTNEREAPMEPPKQKLIARAACSFHHHSRARANDEHARFCVPPFLRALATQTKKKKEKKTRAFDAPAAMAGCVWRARTAPNTLERPYVFCNDHDLSLSLSRCFFSQGVKLQGGCSLTISLFSKQNARRPAPSHALSKHTPLLPPFKNNHERGIKRQRRRERGSNDQASEAFSFCFHLLCVFVLESGVRGGGRRGEQTASPAPRKEKQNRAPQKSISPCAP